MNEIIEIITNTDEAVLRLMGEHGRLIYVILFLIIFAETGIVFFPFLPGDGLLLTVGVIASTGAMNINILLISLIAAAILGNISNYYIGRLAGHRFMKIKNERFHSYLKRTNDFYDEHGGKAVAFSRFLPILRTYVPFVAGITKMNQATFNLYNIVGGAAWVLIFTFGGYLLGDQPWFKENFATFFTVLMLLTLVPFIWGLIKSAREATVTDQNNSNK